MAAYSQDITVNWGESDPFGLVYYPRELAWFNDVEHELFRQIGFPIDRMIRKDNTAFVMGEIKFRFIGPAAYGDRVRCSIALTRIGGSTLHWHCTAVNLRNGEQVTEGTATRVFAQIQEDGNLKSARVPDEIRNALASYGEESERPLLDSINVP